MNNMYAIVETSGRQYKVEPGMVLELNRIAAEPGDKLTLEDVLMVNADGEVKMGSPKVENASVEVEVLEHRRGKKVIAFKMKRRKRYRVKKGHRQELTTVEVKDIKVG